MYDEAKHALIHHQKRHGGEKQVFTEHVASQVSLLSVAINPSISTHDACHFKRSHVMNVLPCISELVTISDCVTQQILPSRWQTRNNFSSKCPASSICCACKHLLEISLARFSQLLVLKHLACNAYRGVYLASFCQTCRRLIRKLDQYYPSSWPAQRLSLVKVCASLVYSELQLGHASPACAGPRPSAEA
jgi:hypothetical protein